MYSEIFSNFAVPQHPCSIGFGNRIISIGMIAHTWQMQQCEN